jgi:hypothetical protein
MNLTTRFSRLLAGALVAGAVLAPASIAYAQVGPDDITDDTCEPTLEDCSPDPCSEVVEMPLQAVAEEPEPDPDCPEPCAGEGQDEGVLEPEECQPEPCTNEADCPDPGPDPDPDPDPHDPPVVGEPNFTG